MKRLLILLLALLFPATARAYDVYDITCDNVAGIRIERLRDTLGNITSFGWHHTVRFVLTPEAAKAFVRLRDAAPMVPIMFRDRIYPRENLRVISHRHPLAVRATALTEYGDQAITFVVVREQEAFELAKTVCPALVPAKVLAEGRLLDPDPTNPPVPEGVADGLGDMAFDISCTNVSSVQIIREQGGRFGLPDPQDRVHMVFFRLKPEAEDKFELILTAWRMQGRVPGGQPRWKLAITANGRPLRNDVPEIQAHSGRYVNTLILREQDAFDAARAVCPALVPELIVAPGLPPSGRTE